MVRGRKNRHFYVLILIIQIMGVCRQDDFAGNTLTKPFSDMTDNVAMDLVSMSSLSVAGTGSGWVNTVPSAKRSTYAASRRGMKKTKV